MAYLGNDLQVAFPVYRNIDDISGSFNSATTSFPLTVNGIAPVPAPRYSQQCLISVGGVVQRPDDTGTEGFRLSGSNIIFASAPTTGADFFGIILAGADYVNAGGNYPSGTAAVPSITFNDDLDTGIYNSGINQLSFATGGSERLRIDSAGQIESISLGSAAVPAFSFTNDPDSGIYSPGANQIAISTGGTDRLFVASDGKVGIGTSSPSKKLTVVDADNQISATNATNEVILRANTTEAAVYTFQAIPLSFYTNNAERLRITSDGKVGIGTIAPSLKLSVDGDAWFGNGAGVETGRLFNDAGVLHLRATSNVTGLALGTNGSEKVRITSDGKVGIGTSSPNNKLHVIGSGDVARFDSSTTDAGLLFFDSVGGSRIGTRSASLIFDTGSAERVRIDSSGRLLVGTSTARTNFFNTSGSGADLQVEGLGFASITRNINDEYAGILGLCKSRGAGNVIVQNDDFLGQVTFQGSDGSEFVEAAAIHCAVDGTPGANDMPGRLVFFTTADGAPGPTERMRINKDGVTLIGTQSVNGTAGLTFSPDLTEGSAQIVFNRTSTTNTSFCTLFKNGGTDVGSISYTNTATAYNTSSDYRLKENVVPLTGAIDRVKDLQIYRFNFIADPAKTVDGFIAHEVQDVVPEAIAGEKDAVDGNGNPVYQGIDQSKLVPLLTAALQEAIGEIESLKARVAALESA